MGLLFKAENKVDMSFLEIIFYTLMPFSQMLLRIFKLDGSMNRPYMLFPLFLIPPFSIIPVLFAKWGFFEKGQGGKPIDNYVLIPIFVKFLSIFLFAKSQTPFMKIIVILLGATLGNIMRTTIKRFCNDDNTNVTKVIASSFIGGSIEYSAAAYADVIMSFIPFIGVVFRLFESFGGSGIIAQLISLAIWSFGYVFMYAIVNIVNANKDDEKMCQPNITIFKVFMSVISIFMIIGKEHMDL